MHMITQLRDSETTTVTFFNFEEMCFSLLSDETLMKDENLTFHHPDPRNCLPVNGCLTCIQDGEIYQNTVKETCTKPEDFCLGVKLFIDATHTDIYSNWVLDPVMFTFTFFNNNITRSHHAWRPLGFINDLNQKSSAENNRISSRDKLQDFHSQLKIIFKTIVDSQTSNGFLWDMRFKGRTFRLNMKPVVILIVGDSQGNHKLSGMYGSFSKGARVNHSCDCPRLKTDDETYECSFMKQSYIRQLCSANNNEELKRISQHNIENAIDNLKIGTHEAGLNALMPSEILHQLFLGLMEYALEEFFGEFTDLGLSRLDKFGKVLYTYSKHNSDRTIPSFMCLNGFTNLTRQRGSDRLGICLVIILCIHSKYWKNILKGCKIGPPDELLMSYCYLFEELILYAEWISLDSYDEKTLQTANCKIKLLMGKFKKVTKRASGTKMLLSKFHEMLHIIRDIKLFGPPVGFDGRPGESSHKDTKKSARHTQRRKGLFEKQTAMRLFENLIVRKSMSLLTQNTSDKSITSNSKADDQQLGQYYILNEEGLIQPNLNTNMTNEKNIFKSACKYIYSECTEYHIIKKIRCSTYLKLDDNMKFHCHPNYQNRTSWFDWAIFSWKGENDEEMDVPGRIFSFIILNDDDTNKSKGNKYKSGKYACIQSMESSPVPVSRKTKIIYRGSLEVTKNNEPYFRLVSIDAIKGVCFAVPDIEDTNKCDFFDWIIIESRDLWGNKFLFE